MKAQEIHALTVAHLATLIADFKPTDFVAVIDNTTGRVLPFEIGRAEAAGGAIDGKTVLCISVKTGEQ